MKTFSLKVVDIRQETKDCVTVIFKQPSFKRVIYQAGQYLSLIIRINGRRYVRPYSLSSAPGLDETLNIPVKKVPRGTISNHIIDKVKINDIIEVMEPMGNFILNDTIPVAEHQIYLWGAGSGITPLMAIAKYALNYKKAASVTRAYGNRYFDDIIFKDDIEALQTQFSGVFSARHFITHPFLGEDNPYILQGRIAAKDVSRILSEQPAYVNNSVHYVCRRFINF